MATISLDLRQRVFEARQAGESTAEVAERFAVSTAFVRRLLQRQRQTGTLLPKSGPRGFKPRLDEYADRIRELNAQHPNLHPAEIRDRLGLAVAAITVWRMLVRLGLTLKKKSIRAAGQDRADVAVARQAWTATVAERNAQRLIFLDETWFTTAMDRLHGYRPAVSDSSKPFPLATGKRPASSADLRCAGSSLRWSLTDR